MAGQLLGLGSSVRKGAAPEIAGFKVQTAVYGLPIPIVYGQARVAGNLIHMYPSTATPQIAQGSRSKFVKVDQNVTGYRYTAPIVLALCEGPITGISKVWRDKDAAVAFTFYQTFFGWSVFLGTLTQSPWTFLTANHPSDAVPYQLTAYVAHPSLELPNDILSNYTWEVQGLLQFGSGIVDANPKDILVDVTTDPNHGAGFPSAQLGDLTGYSNYCIAAGLFLSPVLNAQGALTDGLQQLFDATASAAVWSDGKLKVIPYADQAITGHSVTFTPNVTPIYDLTDNDFLDKETPVRVVRKKASECFNQIKVQYEDRALDYNPDVQEAKDQASIEASQLRPAPTIQLAAIKDAATARYIAQLRLQRELNVRNTYTFQLPIRYALLEPMDLVTLTDPGLGLNLTPVRLTIVEENEKGDLNITAEEFPAGIASASRYGAPGAGGTLPANNTPPGSTTATAIFEGPGPLLQSQLEIWIAASGGANWGGCDVYFSSDNVSFTKVGSITKKGNFGVLTSALASAPASPPNDTTHTLAIDLSASSGAVVPGSASDLAALLTLSWINGEFLAYQGAALTSAFHYNLTTLARGLFASPIAAPALTGAPYVRCDDALLKVPYGQGVNGQVVYFKFPAFNVWGLALEDVGSVSSVSHTIGVIAGTMGSGAPVLPLPALSQVATDANNLTASVLAECSPGATPAGSLGYTLTKKVGATAPVTISSGVVSSLPLTVSVNTDPRLITILRLVITDPLFPSKTIAVSLSVSVDGRDGGHSSGTAIGTMGEGDTRSGNGGVPTPKSKIHALDAYSSDGVTPLIDVTLARFTSSMNGPTGIGATVIERGGNKGDNALDPSFNLQTGVTPGAVGSDGYTNIESRRGAVKSAGHAGSGRVGEDDARSGTGGVPTPASRIHPDTLYSSDGVTPLIDTSLKRFTTDMNGPTGITATVIERGGNKGDGGFTGTTGQLVSTAQESGGKNVNRLYAKTLNSDPDSADAVVRGTSFGIPLKAAQDGSGNMDFSTSAWVNKDGNNLRRTGADPTAVGTVIQNVTNSGHAGSSMQESGGKALNRLLAKVLSSDADSLDGTPDGSTYKRVQGVSSSKITTSSSTPRFRCRARTVGVSLANNSFTPVTWDATDDYDIGSLHDPASSNTKIIIPSGGDIGTWLFNVMIMWGNTSTAGERYVAINKNGVLLGASFINATVGGNNTWHQATGFDDAPSVGDYYEAVVFQNSGGALSVESVSFFQAVHLW